MRGSNLQVRQLLRFIVRDILGQQVAVFRVVQFVSQLGINRGVLAEMIEYASESNRRGITSCDAVQED